METMMRQKIKLIGSLIVGCFLGVNFAFSQSLAPERTLENFINYCSDPGDRYSSKLLCKN